MPDADEVDSKEVCKAFGITRQTLHAWRKKGCPHRKVGQNVVFSAGKLRAWVQGGGPGQVGRPKGGRTRRSSRSAAATSKSASGIGVDTSEATLREQLDEADLRKKILQAEKLEIEVQRQRGVLVESAEVELANVRKFGAIRSAFEALPGKVAAELAALDDAVAVERLLDQEVREVLRELSQR